MGDKTAIEWTDSTWNPVSGCTKVSTGCKFCYAERVSKRMGQEFTQVVLRPDRLDIPTRWRRPRRIFVNSMSDLFHEQIPDAFIGDVFAVMMRCWPRHTFQVLTKQADRMREWFRGWYKNQRPSRNVWLGVSCENQEQADKRIPLLLQTPAAVRFVSLEPLLGPIDIQRYLPARCGCPEKFSLDAAVRASCPACLRIAETPAVRWVIVGGESGGPPERALVQKYETKRKDLIHYPASWWELKPEAVTWVRSIRNQCQAVGVPFFFKQWGGTTPKSGGRLLDLRTHEDFPR